MAARAPYVLLLLAAATCARPSGIRTDGASPADVVRPAGSVALDRIGERRPRLDGIDRHAGNGAGVTIYVFDGGIDTANAELRGRVRVGFDAYPGAARVCNPHGTAVAGAAAGASLGVASAASVVDIKVIDCYSRRGGVDGLARAANWVIDDHRQHPGPAVANWSLFVDSMGSIGRVDEAIAALRSEGILVVAAAGNVDCDACRISPANSGRALAVGSTTLVQSGNSWRDVRAAGTAWGDCVDIYAPGDSVLLPGADDGGPSAIWSGTSMAAGYVSGAVALELQRDPAASPDSLVARIKRAATPEFLDRGRKGRFLYIGGPHKSPEP